MNASRATVYNFVSPVNQVNAGIWTLFAGATALLGFRLVCRLRRSGLWWDDYILILSWTVLLSTDVLISYEMATGYVTKTWDDRMLILISISGCGTLIGQTWTKTAFAVTLIRIANKWQRAILGFCIVSMHIYMATKLFVTWAKYCDQKNYQNSWRMQGFCVDYTFVQGLKTGGQVYNIIMDFVLALFPWMVVWKLNMKMWEKVGLCATMSLGMVVAIITAVRTAWTDFPSTVRYDNWYFWHQGLSMVWYSAEVAGTIMVQCIPVMRPVVREIRTSLTVKRFSGDLESGRGSWISRRISGRGSHKVELPGGFEKLEFGDRGPNNLHHKPPAACKTSHISWSPKSSSSMPSETGSATKISSAPRLTISWPLEREDRPVIHVSTDIRVIRTNGIREVFS